MAFLQSLLLSVNRTGYRPQTKFAKVMFLQVSVCPRGGGGHARQGGVCDGRACMGAYMAGRHAWQGVWGGCAWGCAWQGGHAWQGACMTMGAYMAGACVAGGHAWQGVCVLRTPPPPADTTAMAYGQ